MKPRVAINLFAAHKIQTGIGTYLTGLIDGFSRIKLNFEPVLIINKEGKEIFRRYLNKFEYFLAPKITNTIKGRVFYEHTKFNKDLKKKGIDLLHSTVFVSPMNYKGKGILTIHDTTFITHPQYHIPQKRLYFKKMIPRSVRKNNKVVAISENTKKDIIKLFPKYKSKFVYIPYGINQIFNRDISEKKLKGFNKKYHLPDKFILYVGVLEPRKNIDGIISAFSEFAKNFPDIKLVLAGQKGWYYEKIFKKIRNLKLDNKVMHLGHIDYVLLPRLYRKALFFIYPSFYEGFGMPVLESMASNCPVITSGISSTKEIAKNGALFVDPQNIPEITNAMVKLTTDNNLRNKLIKRGQKRASEFSWEKTAERTQKLYMEIIND